MTFRNAACLLMLVSLLAACNSSRVTPTAFPSYDPFLPLDDGTAAATGVLTPTIITTPTSTRRPTPTRAPLTVSPVAPPPADQPPLTATPDEVRILPTPRQDTVMYIVQPGDTLGTIAMQYDISVETIMEANNIEDPNLLDVGRTLDIPAPNPFGSAPSFKIIPDSELVYGPAGVYFDITSFTDSRNGYLETYEEEVHGTVLSGSEIILLVAQNYSINPRLLLALLEYQSGWVTNPEPFNTSYPMGLLDESHFDLYRQLTWAADTLNRGYYLWRANAISTVVLNDGSVAPLDPSINAGTAALQYFFAGLDDREVWEKDASPTGLLLTYYVFFGNPFEYAIEPLVPDALVQPQMSLPFPEGETWFFTGGPHGGWDSGSAWAALDFAPAGDNGSCLASPSWISAIADGLVLRASDGALIQDLDNDGYEQTGWVILYMHVAEDQRAIPGDYLFQGESVGHPSCEGGISNATHVHIARRFNGEWIAADGNLPFNLDGWVSSGNGVEYDGYLTNGQRKIEAWDGANDANAITH